MPSNVLVDAPELKRKSKVVLDSGDKEWTRRYEESVAALRPLITKEFLANLAESARTCGHLVDFTEIVDFVEWCYDVAGVPCPAIKAHEYSK